MRVNSFLIIAFALPILAAANPKQPAGVSLPLAFEANLGQAPSGEFIGHTRGFAVALDGGNLSLTARHSRVSATLRGAAASLPQAEGALPAQVNYFRGQDPSRWVRNVPTWSSVRYANLYPGIDLVYYGGSGARTTSAPAGAAALEYDFVIQPGADPAPLAVQYSGAGSIRVNADGDLALETADGPLLLHKPIAYQEIAGLRRGVDARYRLVGNTARFALGRYDHSRPLIIDPVITWATYFAALAGTTEIAEGAVTDAAGNIYVAGSMISIYGDADIFFSKFNSAGVSTLVNYYGGSYDDFCHAIAVDSTGAFYLAGETVSFDYPADYTYDSYAGYTDAAYISKVDPTGQTLIYSHFFGGSGSQSAYAIALDSQNNAFIAGVTNSVDLPVSMGAAQTVAGGGYDGFVAQFNPAGNGVYSTYFGGSGDDAIYAIAADVAGNVYATGQTGSANFPVSANAFQTKLKGGSNAFAAKFAPASGALTLSTLLGGSADDVGNAIAIDSAGAMYLTGETVSKDFPVIGAPQAKYGGGGDAFLVKLAANAQSLVYSTYLGGSGEDYGNAIALDAAGNAYLAGGTASTDFPVTAGALQITNQGPPNALVAGLSADGSSVLFATYLGGDGALGAAGDFATAIAYNSTVPSLVVVGITSSDNFPATAASFSPTFDGGNSSAFVAQISLAPPSAPMTSGNERPAAAPSRTAPSGAAASAATHLKFRQPHAARRQPR